MKKKVTFLLLVLIIATTLSGCGLKSAIETSCNDLPGVTLDEELGLFNLSPGTVSYLHCNRFAIYEKGQLLLRVYDGDQIYTDSRNIPYSYEDYTMKFEHRGNEILVNSFCGITPIGAWSFSAENGFSDTVTISAEFGLADWQDLRYFTIPASFSILAPSLFSGFSDSGNVVIIIWLLWLIVLHIPAVLCAMTYFTYLEKCFKRKPVTNIWGVLLELDCLFILPCLLIPGVQFLYQSRPALAQYLANILNQNGLLGFPGTLTLHDIPSLTELFSGSLHSITPYLCYIALAVGILLILLRMIFRPSKAGVFMTIPAVLLASLIGTPFLQLLCLWSVPLVILLVIFLGLVALGGGSTNSKPQKSKDFHDVVQIRDASGTWHPVILHTNELFANVTFIDTGESVTLKAHPYKDNVYLDSNNNEWYL